MIWSAEKLPEGCSVRAGLQSYPTIAAGESTCVVTQQCHLDDMSWVHAMKACYLCAVMTAGREQVDSRHTAALSAQGAI